LGSLLILGTVEMFIWFFLSGVISLQQDGWRNAGDVV
jgi:hypothetical protein